MPLIIAATRGLIAFILHTLSRHDQQNNSLERLSSIFSLTISPLTNTYHYNLLPHLVNHFLSTRSLFGARGQWLAIPLLGVGSVAFVLQIVGAALMNKRSLEDNEGKAESVFVAGLVIQMLYILECLGVLGGIWRHVKENGMIGRRTGWGGLLGSMFGGMGVILVSSCSLNIVITILIMEFWIRRLINQLSPQPKSSSPSLDYPTTVILQTPSRPTNHISICSESSHRY